MVLKSRVKAPRWDAWGNKDREAKCRRHPLPSLLENRPEDPFFDEPDEALAICNGTYDGQVCPLRRECLHGALANNEQVGVWGGLSAEQRRWVRSRRRGVDDGGVEIFREDWDQDWIRDFVPSVEELAALLEQEDDDDDVASAA